MTSNLGELLNLMEWIGMLLGVKQVQCSGLAWWEWDTIQYI